MILSRYLIYVKSLTYIRKHRHTSNTAWETVSLAETKISPLMTSVCSQYNYQSVKNVILPFCQVFVLRLSNDNKTPAAV